MTKGLEPPALTNDTLLSLRREGGVAHFPGLARPRRFPCCRFSEEQREWLQQALGELAKRAGELPDMEGADQCRFHLAIEDGNGRCLWSTVLAEGQMPETLIALWRGGNGVPER